MCSLRITLRCLLLPPTCRGIEGDHYRFELPNLTDDDKADKKYKALLMHLLE